MILQDEELQNEFPREKFEHGKLPSEKSWIHSLPQLKDSPVSLKPEETSVTEGDAGSHLRLAKPIGHPTVIWDQHPRRGRVVFAACVQSRRLGVTPQMPLSHAIELLRQGSQQPYQLSQRDIKADDAMLGRLAKFIQRKITPVVALESLDHKKWAGMSRYQRESLIGDVTGVSHLFGGEAGLCEAAISALSGYGLDCRLAIAQTVASAWAFSRYGWTNPARPRVVVSKLAEEKYRGALPIESLRIFPEPYHNLKRLGVDRLDQLFSLPRNALVSRFGKPLVLQLSRMLGDVEEPLRTYRPPSENRHALELEYPTRDFPLLLDRIEKLVIQLCAELAECQKGALRVRLRFTLVDRGKKDLEVGLFSPTVDQQQLTGLLQQQLEATSLVDLVQAIDLSASLTGPLRTVQNDLFGHHGDGKWAEGLSDVDLNRLINALGARLGDHSVVSVSSTKDPLPEEAFRATTLIGLQKKTLSARFSEKGNRVGESRSGTSAPFADDDTTGSFESSHFSESSQFSGEAVAVSQPTWRRDNVSAFRQATRDDPMRRPTALLTKPLRLLVLSADGSFVHRTRSNVLPDQIQLAGKTHDIVHWWGPERIETGWWRDATVRRDYYRVELQDGQWWWIFRGFSASEKVDRQSWWMLHGYFD